MIQQTNIQKRTILSTIGVLAGNALTAASFSFFILPNGFAAGGVTGFSKLVQTFVPFSLSTIVMCVNVLLLLLGFGFLGKSFIAKTISVSLTFPILLEALSYLAQDFAINPVSGTLLAGLTLGIGEGLLIRNGASSGGFDTIAVILNRRKGIPVSIVIGAFDISVIVLQMIGQPLMHTICGIAAIAISSCVVDKVIAVQIPSFRFLFTRSSLIRQ